MPDLTVPEILVCVAGFVGSGLVKGVIGIALPLVALAVLTTVLSVPESVALMTMPILAANFWQGGRPDHLLPVLRRFWSLLAMLALGMAVGTAALVGTDPRLLYGLVGALMVLVTLLRFLAPNLAIRPAQEHWASPLVGLVSGLLGGLTSMYGPPIALYYAALALPKELFIGAIGATYFLAGLPLAVFLALRGVLDGPLLVLSLAACLPVFAGLLVGERLRRRLDQALFRRLVLIGLLLTGLNLVRRAIW